MLPWISNAHAQQRVITIEELFELCDNSNKSVEIARENYSVVNNRYVVYSNTHLSNTAAIINKSKKTTPRRCPFVK